VQQGIGLSLRHIGVLGQIVLRLEPGTWLPPFRAAEKQKMRQRIDPGLDNIGVLPGIKLLVEDG